MNKNGGTKVELLLPNCDPLGLVLFRLGMVLMTFMCTTLVVAVVLGAGVVVGGFSSVKLPTAYSEKQKGER